MPSKKTANRKGTLERIFLEDCAPGTASQRRREGALFSFFQRGAAATLGARMRLLFALVLLTLMGITAARAEQPQAREDIVLTGGCALRFMEHGKAPSRTTSTGSISSTPASSGCSTLRQEHPGDILTWLVYKPAYQRRSRRWAWTSSRNCSRRPKSVGARLVFFSTKEELIGYLNKGYDRDKVKIADFDYIGTPTRPASSSTTATTSTRCRSPGCT